MATNEVKIKSAFRRYDKANGVWKVYYFDDIAEKITCNDGMTVEDKIGNIKGITTDLHNTVTGYALDSTKGAIIDQNSTDIADLKPIVEANKEAVAQHTIDIQEAKNDINSNTNNIFSHDGRIGTNENDIRDLKSKVSTNASGVVKNANDISNLANRMSKSETDIYNLQNAGTYISGMFRRERYTMTVTTNGYGWFDDTKDVTLAGYTPLCIAGFYSQNLKSIILNGTVVTGQVGGSGNDPEHPIVEHIDIIFDVLYVKNE